MLAISIQPTRSNPLVDFPEFKGIWPEISAAIAKEATDEALERNEDGLYLILADGKPIGMTGFYSMKGPVWGLRWHGILPAYRRNGISTLVIFLVLAELMKHHPDARYLAETIPQTDYRAPIEQHFRRLGFEPKAPPETVDWAPHLVQAWGVEIETLILKGFTLGIIPHPNQPHEKGNA